MNDNGTLDLAFDFWDKPPIQLHDIILLEFQRHLGK